MTTKYRKHLSIKCLKKKYTLYKYSRDRIKEVGGGQRGLWAAKLFYTLFS